MAVLVPADGRVLEHKIMYRPEVIGTEAATGTQCFDHYLGTCCPVRRRVCEYAVHEYISTPCTGARAIVVVYCDP